MNFKESRKVVVWLILICTIGVLLVSCGDKEKSTEDATELTTDAPTDNFITESPTDEPTEAPTDKPAEAPADKPTEAPADKPTEAPTDKPTEDPADKPCEHSYDNDCDAECNKCGELRDARHKTVIADAVEPTCVADGTTYGASCEVCGEIFKRAEVIPALGHDYIDHEGKNATCTEIGWNAYQTCSRCDYTTYSEISALGHDYVGHEGKNATCTEIGWNAYQTCSRCDYTTYSEMPSLGHSTVVHGGKAASCTEVGWNAYVTCSRCDYTTYSEIPATGHQLMQHAAKAPSCTEAGWNSHYTCSLCELDTKIEIAAVGHDIRQYEGKEATCTEEGWNDYQKCSRCDYSTYTKIPKLGHLYTEYDGQGATCTQSGWAPYRACQRCGDSNYRETDAPLGHDYIDHEGKNATCTEIGWAAYQTCSRCDYDTYSKIPALGHEEASLEAVQATCTQDGLTQGIKCNRCNSILKKQEIVQATGHSYPDEYITTEQGHSHSCSVCGHNETQSHSFIGQTCEVCGYIKVEITKYEMASVPGAYGVKGYAFDYVIVDGSIIATAQSSPSTNSISSYDIDRGVEIRLQGWIGFSSKSISHFAIFFDGDISNAIQDTSFKSDAEQGVIDAGGEYRFSIYAKTGSLNAGEHTVSFAAVLTDGTYIIMKNMTLTVSGYIESIPDDEIVKAEKEELPGDVVTSMTPTGSNNGYIGSDGLEFDAFATNIEYIGSTQRFRVPISNSLIINVKNSGEVFSEQFNRFKIAYSSSAPLKVIITYCENGQALTDIVYLEAGDNMLFTCLTEGYLSSKYSTDISSLEIQALGSGRIFTFALYGITTESIDIIGSGLTYIENGRFKLGVKLAWGGGISYILDRKDGNPSLGNVINNADTGRLVQQSYYGTNNTSEYQPGSYGSTEAWHYNPVQGGNLYNQASRIIDVVISTGSIYIKAQPRDWAKTELTPSYMENVYTVYSDRIQVDNRFTDYAGFKTNPSRHQELPAFYTVGYLNTFKFYNGTNPWTGGDLQVEKSLAFWGGNSNAYFKLKSGNSETWCAWMNDAADYGIGLYTPNIDILLAGRHGYESEPDTVNPASGSCSYVAPLNSFKIVSYEALEYSYLIAAGSTKEIRDLFTEYKDFADNSDLTSSKFAYSSNRVSG